MDGVGVGSGVGEVDLQCIAFLRPEGRSGNPAVVAPARERHPRRDLKILIDRDGRTLREWDIVALTSIRVAGNGHELDLGSAAADSIWVVAA